MRSIIKKFDSTLFFTILILVALGIIMILSASSQLCEIKNNSPYYFFKRQLVWAGLGVFAMIVLSRIDYNIYKKFAKLIFVVAVVLLLLVLVPGVGSGEIRGAKRWIDLGFMDFQPSEFAKLAVIIFLSASLAVNYKKLKYFFEGLVPYCLIVGIICGLLYLEPHYSSILIIASVSLIILFVAGAKVQHFLMSAMVLIPLGAIGIVVSKYRMDRVTSFLNPWADPSGDGWQVIQSLYALGSGGIFGLGLGQSRQKYLYLPDAHNDFILAIVGEELGLIGMIFVMLLFTILIWRGITIATKAPDLFGGLLATGITSLVAIQVILNIAIITGWFPVTGMPVPFLSYGGTSLLIFMAMMGILLNISRQIEKV